MAVPDIEIEPPTQPEPSHEDGFSRKSKLRLIELVGLALMVAGAVQIVLGLWTQGVATLILGGYLLLCPAQIVRFIERVLPGGSA